MKNFRRILFVSQGLAPEIDALKQALSTARNNGATLDALLISPAFPENLAAYKDRFEESLRERFAADLAAAREALKLDPAALAVSLTIESGEAPAVRIVRHVLRGAHDLVIKAAEPRQSGTGFSVIDMELLRKCPAAVWLSRAISRSRGDIRVAVAVDPESPQPSARALSLRLLQVGRDLADSASGSLGVISCWDYEYEAYLRNNAWIRMSAEEIAETVAQADKSHEQGLGALLKDAAIGGKIEVRRVRGKPADGIPAFVDEQQIDILVMGTVARTGLPGFLIGNTAESVLQSLRCSLVAFKPEGFVSPVSSD
jgi:nucleotide-binding universal stress UspA family protein